MAAIMNHEPRAVPLRGRMCRLLALTTRAGRAACAILGQQGAGRGKQTSGIGSPRHSTPCVPATRPRRWSEDAGPRDHPRRPLLRDDNEDVRRLAVTLRASQKRRCGPTSPQRFPIIDDDLVRRASPRSTRSAPCGSQTPMLASSAASVTATMPAAHPLWD